MLKRICVAPRCGRLESNQVNMSAAPLDNLMQQALDHHHKGRLGEAERLYRQILQQQPSHAAAVHHLGVVAQQSGHLHNAIELMRRSVELDPIALPYRKNLAQALRSAMRFEEARDVLAGVLSSTPDDPNARHEHGLVLDKLGQYEQAIAEYHRAVNLLLSGSNRDTHLLARTYVNLGSAMARLDRHEEALAAANEAVKFRYDYPLAHMNRADALFRLGRLAEAWPEYEWRWKRTDFTEKWPNYRQPVWDGSPLNGRTLLLWHEQGLGDTVQFCRYAPLAAQGGGKVIVLCQPELRRLLGTLSSDTEVAASGGALPAFDVHLPLMSLPRIFSTTMQTIPFPQGYLSADAEAVAKWKARVQNAAPAQLRIGISWAGSPTQANDRNRSFHFSTLDPLMNVERVQYFSLQKGYAAAQLRESAHRERVVDWTSELSDFAETAALMAALDLIVTVDTSVCHVAGALGLPTWTMLTFEPDFRYICDKEQSSWYTSMRLFRQRRHGDWADVISRVTAALDEKVKA
jgi:tetratricopeptide (TPR) repeat protein